MQTSAAAVRISNVSHSTRIQRSTQPGQVVVEDTRLRDWKLSNSGGITNSAAPVRAVLNYAGELLRVRTLSNQTLEIVYAVPADTFTWSSNTISTDALFGSGVDLVQNGSAVQAYWFASDGVTLKTAQSSDGGHTWGSPATVTTLPTQGSGVLPQLCSPMEDMVLFSDSTIGQDDNGNPLTGLYCTLKVSGNWITPFLWGLGGQPLGIEKKVTLPNGQTLPSNLSGVTLDATRVMLCWYGADPRDAFESGLWLQRLANLDTSSTTQHPHWSNPEMLFGTVPLDDENNHSQIWCAFPRLQAVGNEYWVIAMEASLFAGVEKYHLAFFRSSQSRAGWSRWSDREYRQGATSAQAEQVGAYVYDGTTPFQWFDLVYANLVVTAARTFIVGYDKTFFCESTSLVGVDNPNRKLDLTPFVIQRGTNMSVSPGAASSTYVLKNSRGRFNAGSLLTAHRGVKITNRAGYVTSNGDELITLASEYVDTVQQDTPLGENTVTVQTVDGMALLNRMKMDLFWEWFGGRQIAYTQFCDLSMLNVIQGNFRTSASGRLWSGIVRSSDNFRDDIGVFTEEPANGGILEVLFNCAQTWGGPGGGTRNHVGIALQGKAGAVDQFWAVLYNKNAGKFSLHRAVPRTNPNRRKLYRYMTAVASSGTISLSASQRYWLRVGEWQGHIMAWYCGDNSGVPDGNWVNVIDYTSPASPAQNVLPCRTDWWGLIGTRRVTPSGAIGNLSGSGGPAALSNGTAPRYFALRIRTGAQKSTLRKINVVLTQENTNADPMPSVNVMLVTGSASAPDDISDEDNIVYAQDISSLHFSHHTRPNWVYASARPNPTLPRLDANTYYWIVAVINDDLTSGQSYKYWTDTTGTYGTNTTQYSDDGTTWNGMGSVNMTGSIEVDYDNGVVKFVSAHFVSGDSLKTVEELACSLAAKAGILEAQVDDWVNLSQLTLGGDSIYWQPTSLGPIGDFVMDTVVTPVTAVEVVLAASQINSGSTYGYRVKLDPATQKISCYAPGGSLLGSIESLNPIPTAQFELRVAVQQGYILVYANETLLTTFWVGTVDTTTNILTSPSGYIGLVSGSSTWASMRIPELHKTIDYLVLNAGATPEQALSDNFTKPAVGTARQAKYFVQYDGKFRISTFSGATSVDTYQTTLLRPSRVESAQYVVSEVDPQGNYYARRVDGELLDSDGRWYDQVDLTSARTDTDAYADAAWVFQSAKEKANQYTLEVAANFAAEREDRITVLNPADGTQKDYRINEIQYTIPALEDSDILPKMTLNLRSAE